MSNSKPVTIFFSGNFEIDPQELKMKSLDAIDDGNFVSLVIDNAPDDDPDDF